MIKTCLLFFHPSPRGKVCVVGHMHVRTRTQFVVDKVKEMCHAIRAENSEICHGPWLLGQFIPAQVSIPLIAEFHCSRGAKLSTMASSQSFSQTFRCPGLYSQLKVQGTMGWLTVITAAGM